MFSKIFSIHVDGLHCRHVGVQNKRKFVHIVCIKMEVSSQRRKISLFLFTILDDVSYCVLSFGRGGGGWNPAENQDIT